MATWMVTGSTSVQADSREQAIARAAGAHWHLSAQRVEVSGPLDDLRAQLAEVQSEMAEAVNLGQAKRATIGVKLNGDLHMIRNAADRLALDVAHNELERFRDEVKEVRREMLSSVLDMGDPAAQYIAQQ